MSCWALAVLRLRGARAGVLPQQPAAPWGQDEFTRARSAGHGPIPPGPDISPKGTNTFGATAAVPPGQEQTNSGKFSLLSHGKSWGRPHPSAVSHRHALPAAPHGDGDGVGDGDRVTTPPPPQRPPQGTAAEPVAVLPCRAGATRRPQPHRPPHAACCNPWPHPSPGISAAQPGLASEGQEGGGGSGRRAADVEPGSLGCAGQAGAGAAAAGRGQLEVRAGDGAGGGGTVHEGVTGSQPWGQLQRPQQCPGPEGWLGRGRWCQAAWGQGRRVAGTSPS